MYGIDGNTRENYTFFINYEVPAPTFAVDGAKLTGVLQMGFWTGTAFQPTYCQLSNLGPTFDSLPWGGGAAALTADATTGAISPSNVFTAVNGSNIAGTLEREQLSFSLLNATRALVITNPSAGTANLVVNPNPSLAGTTQNISIQVEDGGGITNTVPFTVTFV